jgi:hypothetical protein
MNFLTVRDPGRRDRCGHFERRARRTRCNAHHPGRAGGWRRPRAARARAEHRPARRQFHRHDDPRRRAEQQADRSAQAGMSRHQARDDPDAFHERGSAAFACCRPGNRPRARHELGGAPGRHSRRVACAQRDTFERQRRAGRAAACDVLESSLDDHRAGASGTPAGHLSEREFGDGGGLIAYGPNIPDLFRRAAERVDRILRGAKPGDLPFDEPARFDFVVNLRAARGLGLALSPEIVTAANEV